MRRIPILMLAAALPLAAQQYDLLIQGGRVIDPANGIDAVMDGRARRDHRARG